MAPSPPRGRAVGAGPEGVICLWLQDGRLTLRTDLPAPVPAAGEVLVRVTRAGICGTDLALIDGMYGFRGIPGHEFVGVATGGPHGIRGRRVVGEINIGCGACPACRRGDRKHCDRRKALGIRNHHGAFAEYLVVPAENIHLVPDGLSDDAASFTEPLAAALDVLDKFDIELANRILVIGDGKLGQLVCRVLALTPAVVDVAGHHAEKLERLSGFAARTYINDDFEPASYDVVVECSGNATGLSGALAALRPRGTLIIKSTFSGAAAVDASRIVVDELRMTGSRCGPFRNALLLLEQGRVDPIPLIDARYALDDAVEAIAHSRKDGVLKVLLGAD